MKTLTKNDMPRFAPETLELDNGLRLSVDCENDTDHGAPWENEDGHGEVSIYTARAKKPGERVLISDGGLNRYYDFAAAVKLAMKDGWDADPYHAAFPTETKRQKAVRAVEADFNRMKDWCNDRWCYVGVIVSLYDSEGNFVGKDSLWAVESDGDYWREVAAEMANTLIAVSPVSNPFRQRKENKRAAPARETRLETK